MEMCTKPFSTYCCLSMWSSFLRHMVLKSHEIRKHSCCFGCLSYLPGCVNINSAINHQSQFSWKVAVISECLLQRLCCSVLPVCLPLCVWLLCCAAGITLGISGILAAPVDGAEMTVLIMHPPALTPCDFCDLKWHKREITWVRQQGKKSHITQCRLGWTISPWALWGFSIQTWRAVSPTQFGLD